MNWQEMPGETGEDDVHALAGAYALDAVDSQERAVFEQHLATCEECRREVAEFSETTAALSEGLSVEPPPALRDQLLDEIAATPQDEEPPGSGNSPDQSAPSVGRMDQLAARRSRRRVSRRWLVAGAAAAAIAVGAVVVSQWPEDAADPRIAAVQEVLDASDAVHSTTTVDNTTITVVTASSLERAVLLTEDLAEAPEGSDYQMWFVHDDGTAVSAGLMPRDTDSGDSSEVVLEGDPEGATAVGITLEPAGGSEQPTSDPIVAVPLQG